MLIAVDGSELSRRTIGSLLLGSVTQRVVHQAKVPVLLVR